MWMAQGFAGWRSVAACGVAAACAVGGLAATGSHHRWWKDFSGGEGSGRRYYSVFVGNRRVGDGDAGDKLKKARVEPCRGSFFFRYQVEAVAHVTAGPTAPAVALGVGKVKLNGAVPVDSDAPSKAAWPGQLAGELKQQIRSKAELPRYSGQVVYLRLGDRVYKTQASKFGPRKNKLSHKRGAVSAVVRRDPAIALPQHKRLLRKQQQGMELIVVTEDSPELDGMRMPDGREYRVVGHVVRGMEAFDNVAAARTGGRLAGAPPGVDALSEEVAVVIDPRSMGSQ